MGATRAWPDAALRLWMVGPTPNLRLSDQNHTVEKASLYASAEIPEYWVLDLKNRQLEVRQQPAEVSDATFGFGYRSLRVFCEEQQVAPGFAPTILVPVAQLLLPKGEST